MIADGKNTLYIEGLNDDVIKCELATYERYKDQPKNILAPELYQCSVDEACEALFDHLTRNVKYKLDPAGKQFVRTPARLLEDKKGDCKSLTMFFVCCLHCLGIPHIIRFVNFDGGDQYTHVYAVAIDEYGKEVILDACEKDDDGYILYDYARPYAKKKDFYFER